MLQRSAIEKRRKVSVSRARRLADYYKRKCAEERRKGRIHLVRVIVHHLASALPRWLARVKVGRLYDKYLTDQATADSFRREYLPEQLQYESGLTLDFGCGRGRHCAMLSQCGFKVVGMDPERHDYWRRIPNAQFLQGGDRELPMFKSESFDLCLSFLVLTYIQDDKEVVRELSRVIKSGGWLVLQTVNQNNLRTVVRHDTLDPQRNTLHQYTIKEAVSMLEEAGFRVERVWTAQFYSPFLTTLFVYLLSVILPHQVAEFMSQHTPPKYRGVINLRAQRIR